MLYIRNHHPQSLLRHQSLRLLKYTNLTTLDAHVQVIAKDAAAHDLNQEQKRHPQHPIQHPMMVILMSTIPMLEVLQQEQAEAPHHLLKKVPQHLLVVHHQLQLLCLLILFQLVG